MAYTAAQINAIYQAVLQHPADITAIQTYAGSSQSDTQVRTQIETSYEASVNVNPIIRLYQGAFGRLPDASGLQANYTTYINGYNITSLAQNFLNSSEGQAKFGTSVSLTSGFVQTVYQQALNRTGSSSELSYWTSSGKSPAQVLAEISNSQEAINKEAVPIVTFLDAQATSTTALGGSGNSSVGGSLYNQTATNFTFTTGSDVIVGSQNNDALTTAGTNVNAGDTINADGGLDSLTITGNLGGVPTTIQNLEVITLNAGGAQTLDFSKATGLSLVTLRAPTAAGSQITLAAGVVAGLDNVTVTGTETFAYGNTATAGSLAVANGTGSTSGTTVTAAITGTSLATLNVLSTGSSGVTTANTVTVTNDGTAIRTLNISGDRALNLTASTGLTALTTIDATANSSGVKFTGTETNLTSAKFGAGNDSFLTGDSFATGATANTATIDGGTGLNYLGANQASLSSLLSSSNKVTNFQVLEVQNAVTAAVTGGQTYDLSKISGLSSIQFDGVVTEATGNGAATFSNLTSGGSINFAANVNTDATNTTAVGTAANLVFTVSGAGTNTNDTETVFFTKGLAAAGASTHLVDAFTIQGVENLVLNNRDIAGTDGLTSFGGVADAQLQTITLQSTAVDSTGAATKAAAFVLGSQFTSNIISSVDASGYNATVDETGMAGQLSATGAVIKGGAGILNALGGVGADTITVGAGGGVVNGGAGIDTINLGSGSTAGVTVGGTAVLSVANFTNNNGAGTGATGSGSFSTADTVNGFHLGSTAATSDVISLGGSAALTTTGASTGAVAFTVGSAAVAAQAAASTAGNTATAGVSVAIDTKGFATVSGTTSTAGAVTAIENYLDTVGTNTTAAFKVGSDVYVIGSGAAIFNGGAGAAASQTAGLADDYVVKLAGLSSADTLSTTAYGTTTIHLA